MKTLDWIKKNISNGNICLEYSYRINSAKSKVGIFESFCDLSGFMFLCEMSQKEEGLPYEIFERDFKRYINGGYVAKMDLYTAAVYCSYDDAEPIDAVESLYLFLNSRARVVIPKGSRTIILADAKSDIELVVGEDSVVRIYDCNDRVRVVEQHGNGIVKRFN